MVVRSLHEVVQQVVDSQGDIARALSAAEQFSHDSGCTLVLMLTLICFDDDMSDFLLLTLLLLLYRLSTDPSCSLSLHSAIFCWSFAPSYIVITTFVSHLPYQSPFIHLSWYSVRCFLQVYNIYVYFFTWCHSFPWMNHTVWQPKSAWRCFSLIEFYLTVDLAHFGGLSYLCFINVIINSNNNKWLKNFWRKAASPSCHPLWQQMGSSELDPI